MHGELFKSRFDEPGAAPFDDDRLYLRLEDVPRSPRGALLRPHICWFGETPFEMDRIAQALDACTLFVCIGSSGAVYPAAGFVAHVRARLRGRPRTVYVGLERPDNAEAFDDVRLGPAGALVPTLFQIVN
jgi:NAD-dependent deacetylase